jgi:hypothetical protein
MARSSKSSSRVAVAAAVAALTLGATGAHAAADTACTVAGVAFADPAGFCPYGYAPKLYEANAVVNAGATPTVEACCQRATDIMAFPECRSVTAAGAAAGVQAVVADDSSWKVQDGNGFTRSVGKYTGMCFSVKIDKADCGGPNAATTCCTSKPPAFMQFKVNAAPAAGCRFSYGAANAQPSALKRITKWLAIGNGADDTAVYFNVPIVWKKGSKTGTACMYTLDQEDATCAFEKVCGLNDNRVPDADGSFDEGCELRVIGRKTAASSACCAPTLSVTSFDSLDENRLAGAPASGKIELQG